MANTYHKNLVDADLHAPGYVQASDPGAVGANILWVDTTAGTGAWVTKVRNATNTGWETVSALTPCVLLTTNQTVAGTKTFSSFPVTPSSAPTTDYQVSNKKYVDDQAPNDMPTGLTKAATTLSGNGSYVTNGTYSYLSIGKDSSGKLTMASGIANTGTAIPLPTDCVEADCHWTVGVTSVTGISYAMAGWECSIDASRIVTIRCRNNNWVA